MSIPNVTQLKQAVTIVEQIEKLQGQLASILGGQTAAKSFSYSLDTANIKRKRKKRNMSPEGRANIIAAQKARWAKVKSAANTAAKSRKK